MKVNKSTAKNLIHLFAYSEEFTLYIQYKNGGAVSGHGKKVLFVTVNEG